MNTPTLLQPPESSIELSHSIQRIKNTCNKGKLFRHLVTLHSCIDDFLKMKLPQRPTVDERKIYDETRRRIYHATWIAPEVFLNSQGSLRSLMAQVCVQHGVEVEERSQQAHREGRKNLLDLQADDVQIALTRSTASTVQLLLGSIPAQEFDALNNSLAFITRAGRGAENAWEDIRKRIHQRIPNIRGVS